MKISVAQFGPTTDAAANRSEIGALVAQSVAEGARLVVLPEEAMLLAEDLPAPLAEVVATEWALFEQFLIDLAVQHSVAIIAGGYEPNGTDRPFNTLIAIDTDGTVAARYHKLHLYDAFAYQESGYVTPGQELPPVVELAGIRVGLINCYDLRFPEQAALLDRPGRRGAQPLGRLGGRGAQGRPLGHPRPGPRHREHRLGGRGRQHLAGLHRQQHDHRPARHHPGQPR